MGRRSTNPSPATGAALPFATVGMTILPGRSLPDWAEPAAAAAEAAAQSGPELIADAPLAAADAAFPAAEQLAEAPSQVPQEWSAEAAPHAPVTHAAGLQAEATRAPEPAFAMAGAAMVAGSTAGLAGYGPTDHGYPPEASRYPAAPAAGLTAMAAAPAFPTQTGPPAPVDHIGAGGVATATHVAGTDSRPGGGALAPGQTGQALGAPPEAPSSGWKSPERPELSPEHVALLSWWADMIAAGQFPAPAGTPGTEATAPEKKPRRSFPAKTAAIVLVVVAAVGAVAVVGPKVMAASEPAVVPATELSLPATVGALVAITDPAVGTELEPLLGFGLRPAGVTVTGAYGTAAGGPLAMAAMATTMGAPAEAVGQIAAWAERTGATVAPSVTGTGANEGITCTSVPAIPDAQPGSFCVWMASGQRGQTYSVAMSVEEAQSLTNEVRAAVTGA